MARKKSALEKQLELSLKRIAQAKEFSEANPDVKFDSLGDRLKAMDNANMPDALAGDEAFEDEEEDDLETRDWWD